MFAVATRGFVKISEECESPFKEPPSGAQTQLVSRHEAFTFQRDCCFFPLPNVIHIVSERRRVLCHTTADYTQLIMPDGKLNTGGAPQ